MLLLLPLTRIGGLEPPTTGSQCYEILLFTSFPRHVFLRCSNQLSYILDIQDGNDIQINSLIQYIAVTVLNVGMLW